MEINGPFFPTGREECDWCHEERPVMVLEDEPGGWAICEPCHKARLAKRQKLLSVRPCRECGRRFRPEAPAEETCDRCAGERQEAQGRREERARAADGIGLAYGPGRSA